MVRLVTRPELICLMTLNYKDRAILKGRIRSNVSIDKESGCWLWNLSMRKGYGRIKYSGKTWISHRVSFAAFKGDFDDSLDILHSCDVPRCQNPLHLFSGTAKDNVFDMTIKGRRYSMKGLKFGKRHFANGDRNPGSKLTWDEVQQIIRSNGTMRSIAAMYGVRHSTINRIKNGKAWAYATGL